MKVFENFKAISAIPRESGNEEGIRKFLVKWAKENNFKYAVDKIGNVIVYCEATEGYEKVAPLALQGHMDMVCVKTLDSKHDFTKDGIDVYEDGDFLRARDTSLGGDNGIAVAMVMDVFTDKNSKHGPLEAIFTVSEETGLTGAFNLDETLIKSRKLINLDSEDEGIIYIGCAGGSDVTAKLKITEVPLPSE
ncbi:MAG: M20/M25/M40 family metallo-hydrolase, partial [Sphaerochaetaceae bacterium]|nr:M20/M25/M40 family metallo-hydrolase [Sphaerochaetaceae bacterium]